MDHEKFEKDAKKKVDEAVAAAAGGDVEAGLTALNKVRYDNMRTGALGEKAQFDQQHETHMRKIDEAERLDLAAQIAILRASKK
jgi:hypothetical protein